MRSSPRPPGNSGVPPTAGSREVPHGAARDGGACSRPKGWHRSWLSCVTVALWLPRQAGPIDLRWDGGVYYLLGTSLAEGRGYRLLNEPGEIEARAVPATPARRRRRSPARARNERPDNRRAVASPVLIPRLRGVRARGAVVPPVVPAAGTCVAGRSAVGLLPARMVPVGHVVPRGFLQRRDGALPDLRPRAGEAGRTRFWPTSVRSPRTRCGRWASLHSPCGCSRA